MTVQQLRDTLDNLEMRDLIARFPCGHSNIYFSTTMDYTALQAAVGELRQKKNKIASRRELERNQTGTKKEPMKNNPAKCGEKEPMKKEEPFDHQDGAKNGTKGGTKTGTNEINAPKQMPLNKSLQINGETARPLSDVQIEAGFEQAAVELPDAAKKALEEYRREFDPIKLKR